MTDRPHHSDRSISPLLVAHVDYLGRLRGRMVPETSQVSGHSPSVTFNRANLNLTVRDDLPAQPVLPSSEGDFATVGVSESRRPFGVGSAEHLIFTRFEELDGRSFEGCPRSTLERQVDALTVLGLEAQVGFEQEGYLVQPIDGSAQRMGRKDFSGARSLAEMEKFITAVFLGSAQAGLRLLQFSKEMGPHQFELNLPPANPLRASEDYTVLREVVHQAAADSGLQASFMPRPWTEVSSAGLHVHLSLYQPDGKNAMDTGEGASLGPLGERAVAGLLEHARALAFLSMPTVNSYKRLEHGSWVPVLAAYSPSHRDALVRFVGAGADRRIEFRAADGCVNPYFLTAGLLAAMMDGLENELELPRALEIADGERLPCEEEWERRGLPLLPRTLEEARIAFENDSVLRSALGPVITAVLLQVKRIEWESYLREVGEWERQTYLCY